MMGMSQAHATFILTHRNFSLQCTLGNAKDLLAVHKGTVNVQP